MQHDFANPEHFRQCDVYDTPEALAACGRDAGNDPPFKGQKFSPKRQISVKEAKALRAVAVASADVYEALPHDRAWDEAESRLFHKVSGPLIQILATVGHRHYSFRHNGCSYAFRITGEGKVQFRKG